MNAPVISIVRGTNSAGKGTIDPDPISTEIVRFALRSAANQMHVALLRTSVSPIIYETIDFSIAVFDAQMRLLSQSPGLALFLGSMSFVLEAGVRQSGGVEALKPGDVIFLNVPFDTGTHPNDGAVMSPVFSPEGKLVAYVAIKMHLSDVGGKAPYITDSIDSFQEGTLYPAVKLYKAGVLDAELQRLLLANSRVPKQVAGDVAAGVSALQIGTREVLRIIDRIGQERFDIAVEHMLNHSDAEITAFIERLPDGRYEASGKLDNSGVSDTPVPISLAIDIKGSEITFDFTGCKHLAEGPYNSPLPLTVSTCRMAICLLAGCDLPDEGHFRAISIKTLPKTLFHPEPPAPVFMGYWSCMLALELIFKAISEIDPALVPAGSGGCVCGTMMWGYRDKDGEPWCDGQALPVGQGGSAHGDGISFCHTTVGAQRISPVEVWEQKWPLITECEEFITDSCGAGEFRGGPGLRVVYRALEDFHATATIERTQFPPWGIDGGLPASPNDHKVHYPDGSKSKRTKFTGEFVPRGSRIETLTGGGGGYGDPTKRSRERVAADYHGGYISADYVRRNYPQAVDILTESSGGDC
jgi:N-methylhydantoinase B